MGRAATIEAEEIDPKEDGESVAGSERCRDVQGFLQRRLHDHEQV